MVLGFARNSQPTIYWQPEPLIQETRLITDEEEEKNDILHGEFVEPDTSWLEEIERSLERRFESISAENIQERMDDELGAGWFGFLQEVSAANGGSIGF